MKARLIQGYIEDAEADVIVNAADCCIWFGDGVDGSLRQRGGWDYIHACQEVARKYAPIPTGEVVFMRNPSAHLKCRYIAHAVSPCWQDNQPYEILTELVKKLLIRSKKKGIKKIAMPILGSGAFRLCINRAYRSINNTINKTSGRIEVLIIHPDFCQSY